MRSRALRSTTRFLAASSLVLAATSQDLGAQNRTPARSSAPQSAQASDSSIRQSKKARAVGRTVLGSAAFVIGKSLAATAAVADVGYRYASGESFKDAVSHTASDAKKVAKKAAPIVKKVDDKYSEKVGSATISVVKASTKAAKAAKAARDSGRTRR